jgi:hypothetical protein
MKEGGIANRKSSKRSSRDTARRESELGFRMLLKENVQEKEHPSSAL